MVTQLAHTRGVYRFAPSPNGYLHLGHALSALTGFERARAAGGRFLLRLEDIDVTRCRWEYACAIFEDLSWLGLRWELPVLRQSEHFGRYLRAAQGLWSRGLAYPCFATRTEIDRAVAEACCGTDPDGAPLYPGLYRHRPAGDTAPRMASGEPFALRLDMARAIEAARAELGPRALAFTELGEAGPRRIMAHPEDFGDVVLLRKEWPASYHLCVVLDDALQGVTEVTRGKDLFRATDVHRLLQVLLDLPEPAYHHHRLLMDPTGQKLAKSTGAPSVRSMREAGLTPAHILSQALMPHLYVSQRLDQC